MKSLSDLDELQDLTPEDRILARLEYLYPDSEPEALLQRLLQLIQQYKRPGRRNLYKWTEDDIILVTYGDSIQDGIHPPLEVLREFLREYAFDLVSGVHILPYFPYSSDDGFSVIDYMQVDPDLGTWEDIKAITEHCFLMTDLVINHVSRSHLWFLDYLNNEEVHSHFFHETDPNEDLSAVVRPRSSPLLVPVHTHRGRRHVWATFSEDQIDLNFANPEVLIEIVKALLLYIQQGSRFIRLDAVAYLWKEIGSQCIHLPQTHQVVKLLRDISKLVDHQTVLITETNVPNTENLSYFGNGDEAHMVYQFTLPPLLLYSLFTGDAQQLTTWAKQQPEPPARCTYLNFVASHDGIGVRPVEGILAESQLNHLLHAMRERGGYVSMKTNADGSQSPYEINISLFDALAVTQTGLDQWHVQRFLCSQAIMLALQGIPAIYIHSLTATPNDTIGVELTGRTRSINRHKWDKSALLGLLKSHTPNAEVFLEMRKLCKIRRFQKAFHPDAKQQIVDLDPALFIIRRTALRGEQAIFAINNVSAQFKHIGLDALGIDPRQPRIQDLISGEVIGIEQNRLELHPYQTIWLSLTPY